MLEAHLHVTGEHVSKVERGGKEGLRGGGGWEGGDGGGGGGKRGFGGGGGWSAYLQTLGTRPERQLWGCQLMGSLAGLTQQCSNR